MQGHIIDAVGKLTAVTNVGWTSYINAHSKTKVNSIYKSLFTEKTKVNSTDFLDQYASFFGG